MKATDITQAIYKSYEQEFNGEFRPHLGASMGGDPCLRKLWYSFRHAKMVNFDGRMLKLFQRGHREEFMFIDDLKRAGIHITNEDENGNQFRLGSLANKHVSGSSDGFGECRVDSLPSLQKGEWLLVEMKTHGEKSFKKLEKEGVDYDTARAQYDKLKNSFKNVEVEKTNDSQTKGADVDQEKVVAPESSESPSFLENIKSNLGSTLGKFKYSNPLVSDAVEKERKRKKIKETGREDFYVDKENADIDFSKLDDVNFDTFKINTNTQCFYFFGSTQCFN